ncbi:MAG: UDP-N-acetylmuramate dehydrogenase [Brevinemataceae bacterium]
MYKSEHIVNLMRESFPNILCTEDVLLSEYTSMKVGGTAVAMVFPDSIENTVKILDFLSGHNITFFVLGGGSNLIVNDEGVDLIFVNTQNLNRITLDSQDSSVIKVEAGVSLSDLSAFALNHGLSGLEFACGIPGTVGGGVFMNAGAYDGEIKDVLSHSKVFCSSQGVYHLPAEEHQFGYRRSVFTDMKGMCILECSFTLKKIESKEEIISKVDNFTTLRTTKQPLELPSAGSTFKRPEGYFAGKLISDAGLQGYSIGGASVSTKHAGFIVNHNNAKAEDIISLIDYIRKTVHSKFGVLLEPEVKFLEKDGSFRQF